MTNSGKRAVRMVRFATAASVASCVVAVLSSPPAAANDSAAELGAGGIELVKTDGIAMLREDLTIGRNEIRVAYVFRNETSAPVTTRVAFPVPEWDDDDEQDMDMDRGSKNPMHFSVTVDGKPVKFETEIKRRRSRVKITHHWVQTFPPGRDLKVEHRYRPAAGGFFVPGKPYENADVDRILTEQYCVGPALLKELKRNDSYVHTVHYILKSGANWRGPIREFKLTLVKEKPGDKISVCLPDTRKASPTAFVVERRDFTPTEDLRILFVPAGS